MVLILLIFLNFINSSKNVYANEVKIQNFGFICEDLKKTKSKFEFIFSRNSNDTEDIVFRRIDGEFEYIGNVLAKKVAHTFCGRIKFFLEQLTLLGYLIRSHQF